MRRVWAAKAHLTPLMLKLQSRSLRWPAWKKSEAQGGYVPRFGVISVIDFDLSLTQISMSLQMFPLVTSDEDKWNLSLNFCGPTWPTLPICLSVRLSRLLVSSYRLSILVSFSTWSPHDFFLSVWTCAVFTRAIPPIPFLPLLLRSFHLRQPVLSISSCFSGVIWGLPLNSFLCLKPLSCPVVNPFHRLLLIFSVFVFRSVSFKQLSFHSRSDEAHSLAGNMLDKALRHCSETEVKIRESII